MAKVVFVLHSSDNVATVLGGDIVPGEVLPLRGTSAGILDTEAEIPDGHKFALVDIAAGEPVVKYGARIGRMTAAVRKGHHVHIHNMESQRGRGDLLSH